MSIRKLSRSKALSYNIRRFSAATSISRWLQSKGLTDERLIQGVKNAFGGSPSISDLSSLGDAGLKTLTEAVQRELSSKTLHSLDDIVVNITVPHQRNVLTIKATEGESFYDIVQRDMNLAQYLPCACRGIAACSSCHIYVDPEYLAKLPKPQEDELDMLDLAWGPKNTSRLGCQVKFNKHLDGMKVTIPGQSHDLFSGN
jgi:ferredoxin